jgi:hypothetical protein
MRTARVGKRKRHKLGAPRPRRRRPLTEDEEIEAEQLAIGPGDKAEGA